MSINSFRLSFSYSFLSCQSFQIIPRCFSFRCVIDFPAIVFTIPPEIVFTYYGFLLGFLFPVSMITTFYILVLIRLNRIRRRHQSELKQRSHRKVTRIVLAVITAYFICWVPYWFLQIFITIDPLVQSLRLNFSILPAHTSMKFLKELTHLTTIFGYMNNCLNPVLYVFLSESFREEYLIVLKCFDPSTAFPNNTFRSGHLSPTAFERDPYPRISTQTQRYRDFLKTKPKHSVAIDEIPSQYRSLAPCQEQESQVPPLRSHGDHLLVNAAAVQRPNSIEYKPSRRTSRLSVSKASITDAHGNQKGMLMVALSLSPSRPKTVFLDDGGVYCGN